jgi:uncharacterized protein
MLVIKKSIIPNSGMGLRTTSRIRKGDLIVEYKGENMTWAKCMKRYKGDVTYARYLFYVSPKNCVDAQNTTNELARYANDANGFSKRKGLKNNSEYCIVKGKPYIIATRDIPANSEILVDYSGDYWEAMQEEIDRKKKLAEKEEKLKTKAAAEKGKKKSKKAPSKKRGK